VLSGTFKNIFAAAVLFAALLSCASSSFSAMTGGDMAIPTNVISSGGGKSDIATLTGGYSLYSVCGQSTAIGTSETSAYSIKLGHIYTLTGLTIEVIGAPILDWVKINGFGFIAGQVRVIAPHSNIKAHFRDEQGVATVEMFVDASTEAVLFELEPGAGNSSFEGTWNTNIIINEPGTHTFKFHARGSGGLERDYPLLTGRIMGGGVQVIGRPYNFPNPFKPLSGGVTTIQYTLTVNATVTLIIYDITGHEVKRIRSSAGENGGMAGLNQVTWNGESMGNDVVGNGMYLYKIISGNEVIGTGKLVIFD